MNKDRLCTLSWDNSIQLTRTKRAISPVQAQYRATHYATGVITTDSGLVFGGLDDMHDHFKNIGKVTIVYDDEEEQHE